MELDVSWLVDTVDVTETSSDGEVRGDWLKRLVDGKDILWLGVKGVVVNILVVDSILLTTGNTDFLKFINSVKYSKLKALSYHLEELLHWCSTLKILGSGLDVVLNSLLAQIDHVAGEERLTVLLEVLLISIEKTIQPWEELLGAVIGVQNDWNAICWGNGTDVVSSSDTTGN